MKEFDDLVLVLRIAGCSALVVLSMLRYFLSSYVEKFEYDLENHQHK